MNKQLREAHMIIHRAACLKKDLEAVENGNGLTEIQKSVVNNLVAWADKYLIDHYPDTINVRSNGGC